MNKGWNLHMMNCNRWKGEAPNFEAIVNPFMKNIHKIRKYIEVKQKIKKYKKSGVITELLKLPIRISDENPYKHCKNYT